ERAGGERRSPIASREGVAVDLLVAGRVESPRVADRLWILECDPGEHRDLVLGETELLERRNVDGLGQTVELLDAGHGRLERVEPRGADAARLRDAAGSCVPR